MCKTFTAFTVKFVFSGNMTQKLGIVQEATLVSKAQNFMPTSKTYAYFLLSQGEGVDEGCMYLTCT